MRKFITKTVLGCSALLLIASTGSAVAIGSMSNDRAVKAQEAAKARLEGAKLKACETRERVINSILDRIAKRGEQRLSVYSAVADRVQAFYEKRGISLSNYDVLLAEVNAKKEAAQSAINAVKAHDVNFTCDRNDPKGAAAGFKEDLKAEIQALHAYQQSIKNLIVAIKTAISDSARNSLDSRGGEQ